MKAHLRILDYAIPRKRDDEDDGISPLLIGMALWIGLGVLTVGMACILNALAYQ